MYEERIKKAIFGERGLFDILFLNDKTLGIGYYIHFYVLW